MGLQLVARWAAPGLALDVAGAFNIYTSAVDGSSVAQLTSDAGVNQFPRWSPDSTQLAWISSQSGGFEIWVAAADGSSARDITNDPALDDGFYGIAWLPDGSGIIAASSGRVIPARIGSESVPLGVGSIALQTVLLVGALLLAFRLAPLAGGLASAVAGVDALLMALVTPSRCSVWLCWQPGLPSTSLFGLHPIGAGPASPARGPGSQPEWHSRRSTSRCLASSVGLPGIWSWCWAQ